MNHNMSTKFIHSVKVPRIYKESASTVKKVLVDGASFKTLVFKHNHPNVQGIYALVSETLHHCKELQSIIDHTKILVENPRFDPWLARVLITELLWGKKILKSEAKPIVTVLNYKEKLQQALVQNPDAAVDPCDKKRVKLPRYVRINTLLTSIDEALSAFYDDGWKLLPQCDSYTTHLETISNMGYDNFIQDFHIPEVLIFPPGTKFHDHPGYLNGKLLLQDKASCLPAFLLNPKPHSEILDMCSAPGMKTTHLAAIINNEGKIYAVEMNENRYKMLCDFIIHANADCVTAIQADALTISPDQYPNIQYILVDPSCSGSGMVDRIEIRKQDQDNLYNRLGKLQSLQSMILNHALLNFPNVKRVIYSTCSIYPEENECVVDEAMSKFGNTYTLVDLKKKLKNKWINFGSSEYSYYGDKCLYALPNIDHCSGFFLAMFKRKSKLSDIDSTMLVNVEEHVLQQGLQSAYDNKNEVDTTELSKRKRPKKRKIERSNSEDVSNNHNSSEVVKMKSEEVPVEEESKTKKNKKIDLKEIEDLSHKFQPLEELITVVKTKKKKKEKNEKVEDSVKEMEVSNKYIIHNENYDNCSKPLKNDKKRKKKDKHVSETQEQ